MNYSRSSARLPLGLSGALVLASSGPARADVEMIRIDYRAAIGCPTAEQFEERVLRRAQNARRARLDEAARTFVVVIEGGSGDYSGSLAIRENGGSTVARTVTGPTCGDVAGVLALSTILAVDPSASTGPGESDSAGWEPPPPSSPEVAGQGNDRTRAEKTDGVTERTASRSRARRKRTQEPRQRVGEPGEREHDLGTGGWAAWLSLGPALQTGGSPRLALGGAIALEALAGASSRSPLSAVGGELAFRRSLSVTVDGASAAFVFAAARPRICAAALRLGSSLSAGPCLAGEIGFVSATGSRLPAPRTERRFWATAELPVRLELILSGTLRLQLENALVVNLTRYRFLFEDPETPVYRVPSAGFASALRLAAEL